MEDLSADACCSCSCPGARLSLVERSGPDTPEPCVWWGGPRHSHSVDPSFMEFLQCMRGAATLRDRPRFQHPHMLFALRRSGGNLVEVRRGMGKAVSFCGLSSAIGFGSLATASAQGLSSLGVVCAAGILVNTFVAVVLLPSWYRVLHSGAKSGPDRVSPVT